MPFLRDLNFRTVLFSMQWWRGLRAAVAVGAGMLVCHLLGKPSGWVALGSLQVIMVDNGGPYRSRLANIVAVLFGGSLAVTLGVLAGVNLPVAIAVTLLFCFSITLARVVSQPLAASSVVILVCYVVAYGASAHTLAVGEQSGLYFWCGGLWAAVLSLVLWPADPFAPARAAVADVYLTLAELVELLPYTNTHAGLRQFNEALARFRLRLELAQAALAATPARMTSRTVRARNLSALAESADLLLSRLLHFAELGDALGAASLIHLNQISSWLKAALAPIEPALRHRPVSTGKAFAPEGSLSLDLRRKLQQLEEVITAQSNVAEDARSQILSALRDARLSIEIAYEAIRAIWSGAEPLRTQAAQFRASLAGTSPRTATPFLWLETLRSHLTLRSVMFRHALRLSAVVALDVLLMHFFRSSFSRYTHGYWLAMTSLIVLQPYTGETVRRSGERVAGTVAGAILAALLAALVPGEFSVIAAITVGTLFTVATYTVDYALYCFFLTPTIVLMTLPHLQDWHFAAVRMGMTCLGALIAVLAMLVLWPERESLQLPGLLAEGAAADASYLRAVLAFWKSTQEQGLAARIAAERTVLAPARRACGLATNGAEEALDHALLEHALPLNPARARTERLNSGALTFTTYLRRLTQTITTYAAIGAGGQAARTLVETLAVRLEGVADALTGKPKQALVDGRNSALLEALPDTLAGQQLRRIERQVGVLERTTLELVTAIRE